MHLQISLTLLLKHELKTEDIKDHIKMDVKNSMRFQHYTLGIMLFYTVQPLYYSNSHFFAPISGCNSDMCNTYSSYLISQYCANVYPHLFSDLSIKAYQTVVEQRIGL